MMPTPAALGAGPPESVHPPTLTIALGGVRYNQSYPGCGTRTSTSERAARMVVGVM